MRRHYGSFLPISEFDDFIVNNVLFRDGEYLIDALVRYEKAKIQQEIAKQLPNIQQTDIELALEGSAGGGIGLVVGRLIDKM